MRTSEQIYHRVRWDDRFDAGRFTLGVAVRGAAPTRVRLPAFVPGGDIPWHRVLFVEADGVLVWDRASGLDDLDATGAGRVRPARVLPPAFTATTPYGWRRPDGWRPATPGAPPASGARLRVLTWNTLWDRFDADRIHTARRRPLLLAALERADADVIALQEVDADLLAMLAAQPWVRGRYTIGVDPAGRDVEATGLVLLSRLPVRAAGHLGLGQHKAVEAVVVDLPAGPLVVAVTHLTSDHTADGAGRRAVELARVGASLSGVGADVALLGDVNDGGAGPADRLGLRDAWVEVHGAADPAVTFDPARNPLAAVSSLSGRGARLDRVLLRGTGLRADTATLLGDAPATDDGLYLSDHYGVLADLTTEAVGLDGAVLDDAPTARTALVWLPEPSPVVDELRRDHDPQVDRWPPHVGVVFGFVPESRFEAAAAAVSAAVAEIAPFTARLAGVRSFEHRDGATVWLDPAADGTRNWARLRSALAARFPACRGRAEGYVPHLTLGRTTDPRHLAALCARRLAETTATVGALTLLSRRADEPMRPRARVTLGTGEIDWLDETPHDEPPPATGVDRLASALRAALPGGVVHVVGSRRTGCALPDADLDLVAAVPTGTDVAARIAAVLPPTARPRPVTGARVPGLRLTLGALSVDLAVVATDEPAAAEAVARRLELDEPRAVALSAVSDAEAILAAVGPRAAAFGTLARRVKAWARARGLSGAPFGGLPGLAWAVLAARTVLMAGDEDPGALLVRFFGDWAAWDWREPVGLGPAVPTGAPLTVLTPSAPVRSCTGQVDADGRDLLTRELYRAWESVGRGDLLAPPPLHRRHAAWAVVTVRAVPGEEFDVTRGRARGRFLALLACLARGGVRDVHAWPRPVPGEPTRYAVGLGAAPPDAARFAELTADWAAGLRGVEVDRVAGGDLPTLR